MDSPIRVLILEDLPTDAELVQYELRRAGLDFTAIRVQEEQDFCRALEQFRPDLILSDYTLPRFNGMAALRLVQQSAPLVPLVVVTGSLNEETAVECMKAGAADYLLKEHLGRLGPAVRSALAKRRLLEEKATADQALRESEARLESLYRLSRSEWTSERAFIDCALEEAVRITQSRIGYLHFVHRDEKTIQLFAWTKAAISHESEAPTQPYGLDEAGILAQCVRDRIPIIQNECPAGAASPAYPGSRVPVFRHMSVPIIDEGRLVAIGGVGNKDLPYKEADALQLQTYLNDVWRIIVRHRAEDERKHLEEQLRHSQKMEAVGRLAGGIAHDFNNVLTVILQCTEFLQEALQPMDPLLDDVVEIQKAGKRAAQLTRQLLAFSRKGNARPVLLDLNAVTRDMEKMLRRILGEDIELWVNLAPDLAFSRVDRGHVEQVLANIVVNARDAMPGGGKLIIETRNVAFDAATSRLFPNAQPGRYVCLSITDNGTGMSAEVRERIFEPFFTTKEEGRGTGLGLATVYGIVKQAAGFVAVDSHPGHGTRFDIYLPAAQDLSEKEPPAQVIAITSSAETILLVEDDEAVRAVTHRMLSRHGYTVIEARHGMEALALAERSGHPIDILLSDVVLPTISGKELADRMTSLRPGLRVLLMSGHTDRAHLVDGLENPTHEYIQKPFVAEELVRKIQALDRKER